MSCITDAGYNTAWTVYGAGVKAAALVRQVGMLPALIDNAAQLISNWKKQRDIGNANMKISEEERQHAQGTYWPKELEFLAEFGTPEEVEEVDTYGRRFAGHLIPAVARAFALKVKQHRCEANRYCTSAYVRDMQTLYQAQATAVTNAKIMGYCMGFAYAQSKRDLNNERRRQAIALSKGLLGQAASNFKAAMGSLASQGAEIMSDLSGALHYIGFAEQMSVDSVTPYGSRGDAHSNIMGQYYRTVYNDQSSFQNPGNGGNFSDVDSLGRNNYDIYTGKYPNDGSGYFGNINAETENSFSGYAPNNYPQGETLALFQQSDSNRNLGPGGPMIHTGYTTKGDGVFVTVDLDKHAIYDYAPAESLPHLLKAPPR